MQTWWLNLFECSANEDVFYMLYEDAGNLQRARKIFIVKGSEPIPVRACVPRVGESADVGEGSW